ncbi:daunorubicin/doxorubicin resistance ATP-binding protein DrrA [bacterium BMS3Bbin03]|nr:daunorubicin/doxorubicin resistance ATP-binding protein DrrA [bacterium BMS3Bbin03]
MSSVEFQSVTKDFGDVRAVDHLTFSIPQGSIYGILGPNGAGKTTSLRMLMQIILPDSGTIRVFGQYQKNSYLDRIGYLPEERGLYRKMKVNDVVAFFGELHGIKPSDIRKRTTFWLERFDLLEWSNRKVEELSRGMQQKLQFIITIFHEPDLIILDEPFTGLDPVNAQLVKDIIMEEHKRGATIIFSTHLMEQVEKLCDRICLINKGQAILEGKIQDIKQKFGKNHLIVSYTGDSDFLSDSSIQAYNDYGNYVEILLAKEANPQALLKKIVKQAEVYKFELVEPSMHEIFIETVQSLGGDKNE